MEKKSYFAGCFQVKEKMWGTFRRRAGQSVSAAAQLSVLGGRKANISLYRPYGKFQHTKLCLISVVNCLLCKNRMAIPKFASGKNFLKM